MNNTQIFWNKKVLFTYVLAVLVCIIHVQTLNNYTYLAVDKSFMNPHTWFVRLVCRVAVPAFFLLSGMLFFKDYEGLNSYKRKIHSRFHSLVIPYLCWNIIATLFAIFSTMFFSQYFVGRAPADISLSGIFKSIFLFSNNLQFWFIFYLIIFNYAAPLIYISLKNRYVGLCIIFCFLALSNWKGLPCYEPESHIYYLVGAYIGIHHFDWFSRSSEKKVIIGVIGIVSMCVLRIFDMSINVPPLKTMILIVYAVSTFFSFGMFDERLSKSAVPMFVSHSFLIFAMHLNLCSIIGKTLYLLLPKQLSFAWLNFFVTLVLTLFFIEVFARFLQRFMPKCYLILSGSR